jgi:DNA-binding LytR/AlgR family response regulator
MQTTVQNHFPPLYLGNGVRVKWPVADLIYMKAEINYTWFFWKTEKPLLTPRTLKYYEPLLARNPSLLRISRCFVVNLDYVVSYERATHRMVIHLQTGERLSVSRRRIREVYEAMLRYREPTKGVYLN